METKNRFKIWVIGVLLVSLAIPLAVALINYYLDPFWCFSVSNKYNKYQININERVQKTNYLTYRKLTYQGILIGTSRSAFISQKAFSGLTVFNYSINDLAVEEYPEFLNYAKNINGKEFDYIFLGLDFAQATARQTLQNKELTPNYIFSEAKSPFHIIKTLISIDTLKYSMLTYARSMIGDKYFYYTRDNIQIFRKTDPAELKSYNELFLNKYIKYYKNFIYNGRFKDTLKKIKKDHPSSKIIVFTTPDSEPLIKYFIKYDILDHYFRWLSDIIDVYGGCYNFMYPNTVTKYYNEYFTDVVHTYPKTGDMMVDYMYNGKQNNLGFGMYIDRNNFEQKKRFLLNCIKNM
jgi:hypothetical protein